MAIQVFGLKSTSHGKCDLKNSYFEVRLTMWKGFQAKNGISMENMNLNLLQTGPSLKTRLSLYLALTLTK